MMLLAVFVTLSPIVARSSGARVKMGSQKFFEPFLCLSISGYFPHYHTVLTGCVKIQHLSVAASSCEVAAYIVRFTIVLDSRFMSLGVSEQFNRITSNVVMISICTYSLELISLLL